MQGNVTIGNDWMPVWHQNCRAVWAKSIIALQKHNCFEQFVRHLCSMRPHYDAALGEYARSTGADVAGAHHSLLNSGHSLSNSERKQASNWSSASKSSRLISSIYLASWSSPESESERWCGVAWYPNKDCSLRRFLCRPVISSLSVSWASWQASFGLRSSVGNERALTFHRGRPTTEIHCVWLDDVTSESIQRYDYESWQYYQLQLSWNVLTRHETKTVSTETKTKTKTLRLKTKTKTVKMLSRDCLETRQCLEASHHWFYPMSKFTYTDSSLMLWLSGV